jgi:alkaline phosphatase D
MRYVGATSLVGYHNAYCWRSDCQILNNYAGEGNDSKFPFESAKDPFHLYNALANPDPVKPNEYYYTFRYADSAFFVMDTRRYRDDIVAVSDPDERSMLGQEQLTALNNWLVDTNETATWKFVVSSVPFTKLWTYEGQIDTWAAYPSEKNKLLEAFQSVPNVIVISGDRHEFADIRFNGGKHTVREFSTR